MNDPAAQTYPFSWQTLRLLALLFLAAKLAALVLVNPFSDETYYWMWGQHPALSYFDHPPLVGWVEGASAAIFGWSKFALRLPVALTIVADIAILFFFSRRLGGDKQREWFWLAVLLFAATPALFLLTLWALPDHLLVLFLLAALYCFHGVLQAHDRSERDNRLLYLGALAFGLALLSKFTAALFGLGAILFLLLSPRYRSLLRNPHVWGAALLALVMQAPVLVWNIQHDFAGFAYITGGRRAFSGVRLSGTVGYLLGIVLMLSPFLLVAFWRFLTDRRDAAKGFARAIAWTSLLAFLIASFFTNILLHWTAIAYIAAIPFIGAYLRSRLVLIGHMIFGALLMGFVIFNYGIYPVATLIPKAEDPVSVWSHGWDEVALRVEAAKAEHKPGFIAGIGYEIAGELGFALRDRDVISLTDRRDAYDDFFDPAAHAGQSAIIVADRARNIDQATPHFASIELLERVEIVRLGRIIATREIYLGTGYGPDLPRALPLLC